jgi:hypothetical protein
MHSLDMAILYPLAAIAIANLLDPNDPLIESASSFPGLIEHILAFFDAALNGRDYPLASGMYPVDWKVAMALSNLCANRTNVKALRDAGVVVKLTQALQSVNGCEKLCRYSLRALWRLSL